MRFWNICSCSCGKERYFMNYEQFICAVIECAEKKSGKDVVIEKQKVLKNNGLSAEGIALRKAGEKIAPLLYMEEPYERYCRGESIEDLTDLLLEAFRKCPKAPAWDEQEFLDYGRIRGKIVYKLVNAKKNEVMLSQIPHIPVLDLAIIFYLMVFEGEFQNCSVLIRNEHQLFWKVSALDLYQEARANTPKLCPCILCPLTDFLETTELPEECGALVLSNEQGINGAAALLYPQFPQLIRQRVRSNCYLIPSSVHEFLILPEEEGISAGQLAEILRTINVQEVSAQDVLSDNIYYFDGKRLRIAQV